MSFAKIRERTSRDNQDGMTLLELVIGLVIVTMLAGAVAGAFVTAGQSSRNTNGRVQQSNDAQVIAAFLVRDAQAAGGTNPSSAAIDSTLGVSAPATAPDCDRASGSLVVRFDWRDWSDASTSARYVANYYLDTSNNTLVRRECKDGALVVDQELGRAIAGATAACDGNGFNGTCPTNPGLPDTVSLHITSTTNAPTPAYTYTLTASLRATVQNPLNTGNAASVPFLALGGGSCGGGPKASGLAISGSADLRVYGGVATNARDVSGCPAVDFNGNGSSYTAAGSPLQTTLPDPYAGLPTPPGTCPASGGTNPGPVGGVYPEGVYPQSLPSGAVLGPGVFILCTGISGSLTATNGTMLYIAKGAVDVTGNNTIKITAPATGPYAGVAIWQPASNDNDFSIAGGTVLDLGIPPNAGGALYAPNALVALTGSADFTLKALIAKQVYITGNHTISVGVPPATYPAITSPTSLPNGRVGIAYPTTTVQANGGGGAYVWSAVLPAGLTINASTGSISGTPQNAGTLNASVTVTDNLGDVFTLAYTVTILPQPTIANVTPSSRGQASQNQNVTITGSSFDNSATVSFGSGVTVNTVTWNNSTSLTVNVSIASNAGLGTRDVTVTNPDGSIVTKPNAFMVNAAPTISSAAPIAQGVTKTIAVTGSGFSSPASVTLSGPADISVGTVQVVNATTLNVTLTVANNAVTGLRDISVVNGDGGRTTGSGVLSVNVPPTISSVSPASRAKGTNGIHTITGTGFQMVGTTTITISGTRVTVGTVTVVNATTLTVQLTVANNASAGARDVTVINPDGGSFTLTGGFSVT